MADRCLFIGWDAPVRGREERAVETFNEMVGYLGRCQQEGRCESFDITFLDTTGSGLGGFMRVHGTPDQLLAIREDDEFMANLTDAVVSVEGMRVYSGRTGDAIAQQMARFQQAVAKVPQAS